MGPPSLPSHPLAITSAQEFPSPAQDHHGCLLGPPLSGHSAHRTWSDASPWSSEGRRPSGQALRRPQASPHPIADQYFSTRRGAGWTGRPGRSSRSASTYSSTGFKFCPLVTSSINGCTSSCIEQADVTVDIVQERVLVPPNLSHPERPLPAWPNPACWDPAL